MAKREAELLAQRIDLAADEVRTTAKLVLQNMQSMQTEQIQAGVEALDDLVLTIKFDALRIEKLAEEESDALRSIYSLSSDTVDRVRAGGVLGDPTDPLAGMQQMIESLFPGETLEA